MSKFVNLHTHTHYSILDSLILPKELFQKAKELEQSAVAITDHGSLSSIFEGLKYSKEAGVKFIVGCEFYFHSNIEEFKNGTSKEKIRHIILISKNLEGYRNLLYLNKIGFDNAAILGKKVIPLIDWSLIENKRNGLMCLTACGNGIVSQSINLKDFEKAEKDLIRLKEIFGDNLGAEVQANTLSRFGNNFLTPINQIFTNYHIKRLAEKNNIKIIPTSDAHYLVKEDAETHDVFLAIGSMQPTYSNNRLKYISSPDFYLKSEEEIKTFFSRNYGDAFADQIIDNSLYFSSLCEEANWIEPKFTNENGKELPIFPVKNEKDYDKFTEWKNKQIDIIKNSSDDKAYLRYICYNILKERIRGEKYNSYRSRLETELEVLELRDFCSYMLIVADYVNWATRNGVLVGPGRGSVGGSLVAYLLDIHKADPIKYDLIFERFQNKEKASFPDIDLDFAPSGRDMVQNYIRAKYGEEYVAHVSNINTITPKVYSRDLARSCEIGGSRQKAVQLGNDIADSIPKELAKGTIDNLFNKAPLFNEYAKRYSELKKHTKICDKQRANATHAAGLVVSKRPLHQIVPIRKDKDGAIALQFNKKDVEDCGLVKMDTLGLETLDIIETTHKLIKKSGKVSPPNPPRYDEYDKETYDLISRGDTFCVFQLGTSSGTMELCKKVRPKNIEDISHINSLARPAVRDIRKPFIEARNGNSQVKLLHPSLKRAFENTYGFGLYEEALFFLAQDVAGWTLNEADRLRKLTKEKGKNMKQVIQWRDEFIVDAQKNKNIPKNIAIKIWDDVIEAFGGYGFNKSHSILYSMISYQTAFLKAHYPVEFLLANLMYEVKSVNKKEAKKKIDRIKHELRQHKVDIKPPDINKSEMVYTLVSNNTLLTGLDALKNVGEDAIADIITKRPFASFDDFMKRSDPHTMRTSTIQALAAAGCLDSFGIPRKSIFSYCADYKKKMQSLKKKNQDKELVYPWPKEDDWTPVEKYAFETNYLGESFSCSKKEAYGDFFTGRYFTVKDIMKMHDKEKISPLKVEVKDFHEFKVKKLNSKFFGKSMIKTLIEDENGEQIVATIFPDRWEQIQNQIRVRYQNKYKYDIGMVISIAGSVNLYEDEIGLIIENMFDFRPAPQIPKKLLTKKTVSNVKVKEGSENQDNSDDLEDKLYDLGLIEFDEMSDDN